jgi:tetratricopeptide (TPR) repeat protein
MSTRKAVLALAAILLAGCAKDASVTAALPVLDRHAEGLSPDFSGGGQQALYLSFVDGLIKQGRQGAALAFLDSYRQTGERLSPHYWMLRGNALLGVHRNDEAIAAYSELQGTSLASDGWNGRGKIAAEAGDWTSAEGSFRKAVDGAPANADFLNNLAFAELHIDKAGNAAACLEQAHELEPGSDRILTNLVIALTAKGDATQAETIIAGLKDGQRRDAMRAAVKSAVAALNTKGKS